MENPVVRIKSLRITNQTIKLFHYQTKCNYFNLFLNSSLNNLNSTANGANKVLGAWIKSAGIFKEITWSCARLSFSILLQDRNVDDATVAYLMGHTTTAQVRKTYKRHRPKDQSETIRQLPSPEQPFQFLKSPINK